MTAKRRVQFQPQDRPLALHANAYGATFEVLDGEAKPYSLEGDAAVVDVVGPLVHHGSDPWCFWMSYESVEAAVLAAASSSAKAVVLRIDSPGGDALGVGECARALRGICRKAGKPLLAFADGMIASAAYALASAADTIIAPPAALVGSVGVYQPLVDATAADRAMGLSITMIASGERKLDGNPHVPMTDAARAETQRRVDGLADLFFALVAEMRPGASVASMRKLEGATFLGSEAVSVGLVDAVGSWDTVLAMVAGTQQAAATATEQSMADETKDDSKSKARKAFFAAMEHAFNAAFGDEEEDKDKKKDDGEEKSEDKKEPEEKAAAKSDDEPKEEDKKDDMAAKALLSLTREVHQMKVDAAAKEEAAERTTLLASRPDFSETVRGTLAKLPLAQVKEAVEKWERMPLNPAAAASVTGTRGKATNHDAVAPHVAAQMDAAMGLTAGASTGISRVDGGFSTVFQPLTPEQAQARLAEMNKGPVV